jgi:hypothetical protein
LSEYLWKYDYEISLSGAPLAHIIITEANKDDLLQPPMAIPLFTLLNNVVNVLLDVRLLVK